MIKHALLFTLLISPIWAQTTVENPDVADRIIATVNDRVITEGDVGARLALTLRQLGLSEIPAGQRALLIRRSLSELIDEKIKVDAAQTRGLAISDADILNAIRVIEQRNNMPPGGYAEAIRGLEKEARKKLNAEVLWRKVIERTVAPTIIITNREIDRLITQMLQHQTLEEQEIAHIFLPHKEDRTDVDAQLILQEAQQKLAEGESFAQLARAYSEDENARRGGNLGWFAPGELMPELAAALEGLSTSQVSEPVKSDAGWHLLTILNTRTSALVDVNPFTEYHTLKASFDLTEDERTNTRRLRQLQSLLNQRGNAENIIANLQAANFKATLEPWQKLESFPATMQETLATLRPNQISSVQEEENTQTVWRLLATRQQTPPELEAYRARIRERLMQQRIQLAERRFLRELKNTTYIDIRLE